MVSASAIGVLKKITKRFVSIVYKEANIVVKIQTSFEPVPFEKRSRQRKQKWPKRNNGHISGY